MIMQAIAISCLKEMRADGCLILNHAIWQMKTVSTPYIKSKQLGYTVYCLCTVLYSMAC